MNELSVIEKFRANLPPAFAGRQIDELTGNGLRWRTLQNLKSLGKIPLDIFIKQTGGKVLLDRDRLLSWWETRLSKYSRDEPKK